jgi:hypothetical protein
MAKSLMQECIERHKDYRSAYALIARGLSREEALSKARFTTIDLSIDSADVVGKTFYQLTVRSIFRLNKATYCQVDCTCGGQKICRLDHVRYGNTKSCGCRAIKYSLRGEAKIIKGILVKG